MYNLINEVNNLKTDWKIIIKRNFNLQKLNQEINNEVNTYNPEIKIF